MELAHIPLESTKSTSTPRDEKRLTLDIDTDTQELAKVVLLLNDESHSGETDVKHLTTSSEIDVTASPIQAWRHPHAGGQRWRVLN